MDRCERASQKSAEVGAGELPFEGRGDLLIVPLEGEDALGDFALGREVGGGECLALEDREVDLDLVHPARVRGQVHLRARLSNRVQRRSAARWPRWIVPPSTIQKTRLADR